MSKYWEVLKKHVNSENLSAELDEAIGEVFREQKQLQQQLALITTELDKLTVQHFNLGIEYMAKSKEVDKLQAEVAELKRRIDWHIKAHMEYYKSVGDVHKHHHEQIVAVTAERDTAYKLLESLTPGGSEFHNDPEACAKYVRDRIDSKHRALVAAKQALNETYTDDNGIVWTNPTAEAYVQVCKANNAKNIRIRELERALRQIINTITSGRESHCGESTYSVSPITKTTVNAWTKVLMQEEKSKGCNLCEPEPCKGCEVTECDAT